MYFFIDKFVCILHLYRAGNRRIQLKRNSFQRGVRTENPIAKQRRESDSIGARRLVSFICHFARLVFFGEYPMTEWALNVSCLKKNTLDLFQYGKFNFPMQERIFLCADTGASMQVESAGQEQIYSS